MVILKTILLGIIVPLALAIIEIFADALSRSEITEPREDGGFFHPLKKWLWEVGDAGVTLSLGAVGTDVGVLAVGRTNDLGWVLLILHIALLFMVAAVVRRMQEIAGRFNKKESEETYTYTRMRVLFANGIGLFSLFTAFSYSTQLVGFGWSAATATVMAMVIIMYRTYQRYK